MIDIEQVEFPKNWSVFLEQTAPQELGPEMDELARGLLAKLRGASNIAEKLAAINYYFDHFHKLAHKYEFPKRPKCFLSLSYTAYSFARQLQVADEEIYDDIWKAQKLPDLSGEKPPQVGKLVG